MPTIEEEREVRVAAPGLDTPGHRRLKITGSDAGEEVAWIGLRLRVNSELPPFLGNHGSGAGHHWPLVAFYEQRDGESRTVGFHPFTAGFLEAGSFEQLGGNLRIGFPPASTASDGNFFRVFRDLVAHRRP